MYCNSMPHTVRAAMLAEVQSVIQCDTGLPLSEQLFHTKLFNTKGRGCGFFKSKSDKMCSKIDLLSVEMAEMLSLLMSLHSSTGTESAEVLTLPMH